MGNSCTGVVYPGDLAAAGCVDVIAWCGAEVIVGWPLQQGRLVVVDTALHERAEVGQYS